MTYYYNKPEVKPHEYKMYKYLNDKNYNFIPKLFNYDKKNKILKTQLIKGNNVANIYGEEYSELPQNITIQIKNIILKLFQDNIIYPDITGYNFIVDNNSKVWIIDFEHSFYKSNFNSINNNNLYTEQDQQHYNFVYDFCFNGLNNWNPYFK
jgi:tRNA A-37 threonylcarbamoyl transferase component Bud32